MTQLLTQSLGEDLQVLLISDGSFISQQIKEFIQGEQVSVVEIRPSQLVDNQALLTNIKQAQFYKTIFVSGFKNILDSKQQALIISLLQQRAEPKVLVLRSLTAVKKDCEVFSELINWHRAQSSFLNRLSSQLTNKIFILGKDVVEPGLTLQPPLYSICKNIKQYSQIIDPQINLYLQSSQTFFKTFKNKLFSPERRSFSVKGRLVSSVEVSHEIQKFYQLYFRKNLKIISSPLTIDEHSELEFIEVTSSSDFTRVIDRKMRLILDLNLTAVDLKGVGKDFVQADLVRNKTELSTKKAKNEQVKPKVKIEENVKEIDLKSYKQDLEQEFDHLFTRKRKKEKVERRVKKAKKISVIKHKTKHKKVIFFGGLALVITGLLFGASLFGFYFSFNKVKSDFVDQITTLNPNRSETNQTIWFKVVEKSNQIFGDKLDAEQLDVALEMAALDQELSSVSKIKKEREGLIIKAYQLVWSQSNGEMSKVLENVTDLNLKLFEKLSIIQAKIENLELNNFADNEQKKIAQAQKEIKTLRKKIAKLQQADPLLPHLLGIGDKKNYLVLIQDNLELRPTGGFIQAVALITVDEGVIIDTQIFDVYELDQKLAANLVPPSEIKTFLGEERWFLRDSNWDASFPSVAKRASWFVKEIINQQIDGVIGLNYHLVKNLLKQVGPIYLDDYQQEITDKNLFERLIFYSAEQGQKDLGKQTYQVAIFESLLNKLSTLDETKVLSVVNSLFNSLEEKQTLVTLSTESLQSDLEKLDWSGRIIDPDCPSQFTSDYCLVDSFYQVDANVGINKVNSQINRSIDHQISFRQEKIESTRTIVYKNNSRSEVWPLGEYKNYIRFYFNSQATFEKLELDGQLISKESTINYIDHGRQVVGVPVTISPGQTRKVVFEYSLSQPKEEKYSYLLFDQKQPGIKEKTIDFIVEHSPELHPKLIAPKAQVEDQMILFNKERDSHSFIGVEFERFNY